MHLLTQLIREDMKPALGVTEPGAIAFACAKAKSYTKGNLQKLEVAMNSGMYKNAFSCGIPHSSHVGNLYAAALGYLAGDAEKGLLSLEGVTQQDNLDAQALIDSGKVSAVMSSVTSDIFIQATVTTDQNVCQVTIRDTHTNICEIRLDGKVIFEKERSAAQHQEQEAPIHQYTLAQLVEYAQTVPLEEIAFVKEAYQVNMELFQEGLSSTRTGFLHYLYEKNGNEIFSKDPLATAQLLCAGAIEARVIGLDKAAMSITGSGAHGIICTMPLYGVYKVEGLSEETLLRATVLSYLITMYIKEYSGRLSAFCGCAIAAGSGMACALTWMHKGDQAAIEGTLANMASSITGMICDGGNQGCTMKGVVATDAAFRSSELALHHTRIDWVHGINGKTPEETMRNMGRIASPGMTATEKTIVEIMEEKN